MSNQRKYKDLAIWALRYLKNAEGVAAFHAYQKAMGESFDSESDSTETFSRGFIQGFFKDVDSAILWLKNLE